VGLTKTHPLSTTNSYAKGPSPLFQDSANGQSVLSTDGDLEKENDCGGTLRESQNIQSQGATTTNPSNIAESGDALLNQ
jgi:hypothetical protein